MTSIGNDIVDLNHSDADFNKIHPRFLKKILNKEESSYIESNSKGIYLPLNSVYWTYWAAKEAAYKALKRVLPNLSFSYKNFFFNYKLKKVLYKNYDLPCLINQQQNYVHVIAFLLSETFKPFQQRSDFKQYIQEKVYYKVCHREDILKKTNSHLINQFIESTKDGQYNDSSLLRSILVKDLAKIFKWGSDKNISIIKQTHNIQNRNDVPPSRVQVERQVSEYEKIPYVIVNHKVQDILLSLSHHGNYLAYAFFSCWIPKTLDKR